MISYTGIAIFGSGTSRPPRTWCRRPSFAGWTIIPGQREREALPTLYTIARNLCVDVTRQRETLPLQETDQVAADPAGTLVERWDLERALETLTPQDQELLLLRYANQVPLQALSRLTGLSRFAIYRRCGRLLTQLREALREEERT